LNVGIAIGFAVGAAYIIFNLWKWQQNKEAVRGAAIGWAVAGLLLLLCVGYSEEAKTNAPENVAAITSEELSL
jgi:hypothetical protein